MIQSSVLSLIGTAGQRRRESRWGCRAAKRKFQTYGRAILAACVNHVRSQAM